MKKCDEVLSRIRSFASAEVKAKQEYFGIKNINNYGLTAPQVKSIARMIGKNHSLALELWESGVHEARHIAILVADKKMVTSVLMERWIKDFNSWDIVDNACGTLFCRSDLAYEKAIKWSGRKREFEKRAGFALMAMLAVHDKKSGNEKFEQFFPYLIKESNDERNFVCKAVNWAIRQIGKRNKYLCKKMLLLSEEIKEKGDKTSVWIANDALRELNRYLKEGKIKNVGG